MQNNINRASQFKPFEALNGFKEALKLVEKITESPQILSEDIFKELNQKILKLKKEDKVIIKHYYNLEYIETRGVIKKIDTINKILYLSNSKISFDDIICIELEK